MFNYSRFYPLPDASLGDSQDSQVLRLHRVCPLEDCATRPVGSFPLELREGVWYASVPGLYSYAFSHSLFCSTLTLPQSMFNCFCSLEGQGSSSQYTELVVLS